MNTINKTIRWLFPFPDMDYYAKKIYPFLKAQYFIRFFYIFLLYATTGIFSRWDLSLALKTKISLFWPVFWLRYVEFSQGYLFINIFFVVTVLFAAIFPYKRVVRILVFLGLLEFISFYASMSRLDVDWYPWIYIAFILILLPDDWEKPEKFTEILRKKFLLVFWGCQTFFLLIHFMSGIGKFYGAITQALQSQLNTFSFQSGAMHVADRLRITHTTSALGSLIIEYPWLGWAFMAFYPFIFICAIFVAFRPTFHRVYGLLLILFHLGAHFAVNIGFAGHIILIGIFFLDSPFQQTPLIPWQSAVSKFWPLNRLGNRHTNKNL